MSKRHFEPWRVALALAALASIALADQPFQPRKVPAAKQTQAQQLPGQPQRVTANRPVDGRVNADPAIAQCLAIDNEEEIAMAQLAASKTKNDKVRQFAEMLIKDHSGLLPQWQPFGASIARLGPAAAQTANRNPNQPRLPAFNEARTARTDDRAVTQPGDTAATGFDFLTVKRRIAEECLAQAQKHWGEHKAEECDMAFVGYQIAAHGHMLAELKVVRDYASPELQAVIDKAAEATRMHLDHAKDLIRKLDRESNPDKESS